MSETLTLSGRYLTVCIIFELNDFAVKMEAEHSNSQSSVATHLRRDTRSYSSVFCNLFQNRV